MKKSILFIPLLCFSLIEVSQSQIIVQKVGKGNIPANAEGIFYSLPQTVIKVEIVVNKTMEVRGPFAEYAEQLLGINDIVGSSNTRFELKELRLTTYNEPDPSEYYFVQLSAKPKERQAVELFLSADGVLSGIVPYHQTVKGRTEKSGDLSNQAPATPNIANPNVYERMDTVVRRISLDTTLIEQKFYKKTSSAKTLEQKAREAAEFILKLDESMYNLITGYQEVNYEKGTMEFMYRGMSDMKKEYLELFKGSTNKTSETYTYFVILKKNNLTETLCRFSTGKGILSKTATSGDQIQLQAEDLKTTASVAEVVSIMNNTSHPVHGFYFRIPEKTHVSITLGGKALLDTNLTINQLGIVSNLPATTFKNIQLDDNTGMVKHVVLE